MRTDFIVTHKQGFISGDQPPDPRCGVPCRAAAIKLSRHSRSLGLPTSPWVVGEPLRGGVAPGRDELPELAVREAIVNAVCHRDYADNGSVQIMLFSDRLEILNPGTLPKGWTAERLLRTHDSKARNLTIAQALNWAGYVEKSGNGTESIVRRCLDAGLPKPEYHPDNVDFKVIIWRDPARLGPVGAQSGPSRGSVAERQCLQCYRARILSEIVGGGRLGP